MPRHLTWMLVVISVRNLLSITVFPADTHRFLARPGLSFDAYCRVSNQRTGHICAVIIDVADSLSENRDTRFGLVPSFSGDLQLLDMQVEIATFHQQLNFH